MKKEQKEKQLKARADARPKKVMELCGWEILNDERNWITKKANRTYYFSRYEDCLFDIADDLEKGLIKVDLLETVKVLKQAKIDFIKALSEAVQPK